MFFNIPFIAVSPSVGGLPIVTEGDPPEEASGSKKNLNTRLSKIESRYQGQDAAEAVLGGFSNFLENPGAYSKNNTDKHSELIDATIMFAELIKTPSDFTGKFQQLISGIFESKLKSSDNEVQANYIDSLFGALTQRSYKQDEEFLTSIFVLLKEVLNCEIVKTNLSVGKNAAESLINFAVPSGNNTIDDSEKFKDFNHLILDIFSEE